MNDDRRGIRTSTNRALRALLVACAFVASPAASSADVTGATPTQLSPGTSFDVSGAGFGAAPRADLNVGGRKVAVKIARSSITDAQFRARLVDVPRGVVGAATLEVTPRGSKTPFQFAGFSIETPQITSIDPAAGSKNTVVTITGTFFGSGGSTGHPPAGGVVRFGTHAARIATWTDTSIAVKVPVTTFGTYDVTVANHAGSATLSQAFTAGDELVKGSFGARKLNVSGANDVQAHMFTRGAHVRQGQARAQTTIGGTTHAITIAFDFDPTLPFPQTLTNADLGSYSATVSYAVSTNATVTAAYQNAAGATVTVTLASYVESPNEALTGSFQATLVKVVAPGGPVETLKCSGTFSAIVDD